MTLSLDDPAVRAFIVHSAILTVKMFLVTMLTIMNRMFRGVFQNPEDSKLFFWGKVKYDDSNVERVRRAHLNDLENIPAFWLLGALYLTTGPAAWLATLLFRVFTVCRILHTIVYAVIPLPQPSRALAFGVPFIINFYMGIHTVVYYIASV